MRAPRPVAAVREFLPRGSALALDEWELRHRLVTWVLVGQLPLIVAYGLLTHHSLAHSLVEGVAPGAMAVVAHAKGQRLVRAGAGVLGLMLCSAIFVHLSGGLIEWHFHFFVMLALVSLYQEWRIYLIALSFVVIEHVLGGLLAFHAVYNHGHGEWWWGLVHGAFVLAASAFQVTAWRFNEAATARAVALQTELTEGEDSLLARIRRLANMRSELISTASHEFRTPITAIKAAASVLEQHGARLGDDERAELIRGIAKRSEGMATMLDNMLLAVRMEAPDSGQAGSVRAAAEDVLNELGSEDGVARIIVDIPVDVIVACGREPLHLLISRLTQGVAGQGKPGQPVTLSARVPGPIAMVEASVSVAAVTGDVSHLLEAFELAAEGHQAADVGLSLFAARRIAELHGGEMTATVTTDRLFIRAWLPLAEAPLLGDLNDRVDALLPSPRPGSGRVTV